MIVLVTGGAASGKSVFAEQCAMKLHRQNPLANAPLYYLATMECWDAECVARVEKHRAQRAGKGFHTIEVPRDLEKAAETLSPGGTVLLECLGNLTANEQFSADGSSIDPTEKILRGFSALQKKMTHLVIVTNEVFTDLAPDSPAMQQYLQNMGKIGCQIAKEAEVVVEVCAGCPIFWKGKI
jgi:adenosylcobinamide kinase/adenosylcobinamide-phosphate guanylyltransferase